MALQWKSPVEVITDTEQSAGSYTHTLAARLCMTWIMSTASHPLVDGLTEKSDCTGEDMLKHFVSRIVTN